MKLYFSPGACSLAVHIALREAAINFELVKVDLEHHLLPDGSDYFALVRRGYVPALMLDDGSHHTEVAALLQYVAELDPDQPLIGAIGTARRSQVIEWLVFSSTELHKQFSPWLWHKDTAEPTRARVMQTLLKRFAEIEAHLATHEFVAGEFSVADCYLFTMLNWTRMLHLPMTDYPRILGYQARMAARPSVVASIQAERAFK